MLRSAPSARRSSKRCFCGCRAEIAATGSRSGVHHDRDAARMRRPGSMQASSCGRLIRARPSVRSGVPGKGSWDLRAVVPNHCLQPTGANRAAGPVGMPDISIGRAISPAAEATALGVPLRSEQLVFVGVAAERASASPSWGRPALEQA